MHLTPFDPQKLPERMRKRIKFLENGCWEWTGAVQSRGYGSVWLGGASHATHRIAYEMCIGLIPTGLQIDHLCRNKRCCNPAHLEAVTGKVNCERTPEATKTHCVAGHPLAGENLIIKRRPNGLTIRNCRACSLEHARSYRLRNGQRRSYDVRHRYEALVKRSAVAS